MDQVIARPPTQTDDKATRGFSSAERMTEVRELRSEMREPKDEPRAEDTLVAFDHG